MCSPARERWLSSAQPDSPRAARSGVRQYSFHRAKLRVDLDGTVGEGLARILMVVEQNVRIRQDVTLKHVNHSLTAPYGAATRQASRPRHARRACRLATDAGRVDHGLCFQDLRIADIENDSIGVADGTDAAIVRRRISDLDRRRHRFGAHRFSLSEAAAKAPRKRRSALRLHRGQPGNGIDQSGLPRQPKSGAEGRGVAEVSRWKHDPIWRTPSELLQQLEDDCRLAKDAKRVDRVGKVDTEAFRRFAGEAQTVIEVATYEQRARAVRQRLRELPQRHLSGGHEDDGGNSRQRRIGSERRGSIARGCTRHRAGANAHCVTDRDGHSAVFERAGRIVSFVFQEQLRNFRPPRNTLAREQGSVSLPLRHEIFVVDPRQYKLAKSPDARSVDVAALQRTRCTESSVKQRAQRRTALGQEMYLD